MKKLFFDIETISADEDFKDYFQNEYDKKLVHEISFDEFFSKTALDGNFGRIFCIGYALNDGELDCICEDTEAKTLEKFWQIAKDCDLFIGHNVFDFDLKYILKRSVINNVKPTRNLSFARYRNNPIYDTMREWDCWGQSMTSLDKLARILGLETSKGEMDGSKVTEAFHKGDGEKICEYCKQDVRLTRQIYNKINFIEENNRLLN